MTAPVTDPAAPPTAPPTRVPWRGVWGLVAAVAAGATLLTLAPIERPAAPVTDRVPPERAWPGVQRADLPGAVPDGPRYQPLHFTDARTSVGTAVSPDGSRLRLVRRAADGALRELRSLPLGRNPQFTAVTAAGDDLAWAELVEGQPTRVWAVDLRADAAPRPLAADAGNVLFFDSQYDMVIADGRVHWAAGSPDGRDTEIRSVPLAGGPVDVRTERGAWALTAWPWLVNGVAEQSGTTTLRNLATGVARRVQTGPTELVSCSPAWCRVTVTAGTDQARIDVMRPDGTERRRVAGGRVSAALTDVVPLDRFEVVAEPDPNIDLTGTHRLLVHDLVRRTTVSLGAGANAAVYRGGVLWWSTGDRDALVWHTLDLRTA